MTVYQVQGIVEVASDENASVSFQIPNVSFPDKTRPYNLRYFSRGSFENAKNMQNHAIDPEEDS